MPLAKLSLTHNTKAAFVIAMLVPTLSILGMNINSARAGELDASGHRQKSSVESLNDPMTTDPPYPANYCWRLSSGEGAPQNPQFPTTPFMYLPFNATVDWVSNAWNSQFDHHYPDYNLHLDGVVATLGEYELLDDSHSSEPHYQGASGWLKKSPFSNTQFPYTTSAQSIANQGYIAYYYSHLFERYFGYDGHDGHDFGVSGDALAAVDGVVTYAGTRSGGYGNVVEIYHPAGYLLRYAHLQNAYKSKGDNVKAGDPIGKIGGTPYWQVHLHFMAFHWNPNRNSGEWEITDPFGWDPWASPGQQSNDPLYKCNGEVSYNLWFGWWPRNVNGSPTTPSRPRNGHYAGGWLGDDPAPPPPPPPPPPSGKDGIEIVNASSHTVRPGQRFNPSITLRMTSGYLDPVRGDHLHATPEENSNTFGAWPVQPVNSYVPTDGLYTFDVNNNSSFIMTAPNTPGLYQSIWQMRVGGNHIGPQAIININVVADTPSNDITLYDDSNFGGASQSFTYSSNSSCIKLGSINNLANSIKFRGTYNSNYDAVMYGDDNCGVYNARYSQDTSDFALLNDQFSSMRIEKHPWELNANCGADGVTLYGDPNYGGTCLHANNPAYSSSLRDYGLNDAVSSLKIVGNWVLYLWENDSRDGRLIAFTGNVANLADWGFDNTVSSAEVEPPDTCKHLNVTIEPPGSGSVNVNTLVNCGDGYTAGTAVALAASASPSYTFSYWGGNFSSSSQSTAYQIYVDSDVTANFTVSGSQPPPPPPPPISSAAFGTGADDDGTVNTTTYSDNARTPLSASASAGQSMLTVATTTGFAIGDDVLIHQTQGLPTNVGKYEYAKIAGVATSTLTLQQNLVNSYTQGGNARAQVIRVPNYRNLTIQNGGLLTAHPWDGSTGGIIAFRVAGKLDVQTGGAISASSLGYRGAPTNNTMYGGSQGEGQNGPGVQTTGANWEGGGGACSDGGGNPPGAGGGGYGTTGQSGQPGNGSGCATSGIGGDIAGSPELSRLYFGGGGGSGGGKTDNGGMPGGRGGNGGGILILYANTASINGAISANGDNGGVGLGFNTSSNGGGGAGGSIKLLLGNGNLVASNLVSAQPGTGGSYGGSTEDGGNGGLGRVRAEYCDAFTGTTNPAASVYQLTCILNVANDEIEMAQTINSASATTSEQTLGATAAIDDPNLCRLDGEAPGTATIWYRFIPNASGALNVNTIGSNYDTVLAVFTGSRGHLSRLACNDDYNNTNQSALSVMVNADTIYYLEVADYYSPNDPNSKPGYVAQVARGGILNLSLSFIATSVFGTGSDGNVTIPAGTSFTDDVRTALTSNALANTNTLNVASTVGFVANQEVLIHQTQGANVGTFEFGTITNVGGGALTLKRDLVSSYTESGNSKAQVIRVPQYNDLTILNGGNLTAHAWDGATGGIAAFRVLGTLNVQSGGAINVDSKGFRGAPTNNTKYGGSQGEGQNGLGTQITSANGTGGGGSCSDGGGNPPGAGGGGLATAGLNGQPGNGSGCVTSGMGGATIGTSDLSQAFFGGGGGSGGGKTDNGGMPGGYGGSGGGVALIFANNAMINGVVSANGQSGGNGLGFNTSSNGGGGAGGSILLKTRSATASSMTATYGPGGIYGGGSTEDGGHGGDGRIRVEYCNSFSGVTNPSASTLALNCNLTPVAASNVASTVLSPAGGSLSSNGDFQIVFPANAVSASVVVTYTELISPLHPLPSNNIGLRYFKLEATTASGTPVTQFQLPYSLTLRYTYAPLAALGIPESQLTAAYWNGTTWIYLLPCAGCALDTFNNRIILKLDHFTEFAVVSNPSRKVYLPVMSKP